MTQIKELLKELPDRPGVYLMMDEADEVIYVGKAISLRNRVRSYFGSTHGQHAKVTAMVRHIRRFEYIIVDNEIEALVLESNLIKEKKPKYNILLRDDKQYPYILITDQKFPRLLKVRKVEKGRGEYFGPFPNAFAVNDLIEVIQQIYPLRTCNLVFEKGERLKRPCLNYFIGRCTAPCVDKADEAEYLSNIEKIRQFLRGRSDALLREVQGRMEQAAAALQYEAAARYRDHLESIRTLLEKQTVSTTKNVDIDLIAMARSDRYCCVQVFFMRGGKTIEREHFIIEDDYKEKDDEILRAFLLQFYMDSSYIPSEVLVDMLPRESETIERFLTEKRGTHVRLRRPRRGRKTDLLETVRANAKDMLESFEEKMKRRERTRPLGLEQLEERLGLPDLVRIECYDISNVSGAQSVGSMVVFLEGEKAAKEYRKFKIRTLDQPDDVGSHREVLTRRLARGLKEEKKDEGFGQLPNLILIDGGKGQVNAAKAVVREAGLSIPVCGLVKDRFHNTRGLIWNNEEIILPVRTPLYRFLYAIQEEAHRFAHQYHRKLRDTAMRKTVLDDIPGIGPTRRKNLLTAFKTVPAIQEASIDELLQVPGMNKKAAQSVYDFFRGGEHEKS